MTPMGKSYADKYRIIKTTKGMKRLANKRVRRDPEFDISGTAYRKLFSSWDINDGGRARPIPANEEWAEPLRRK